MIEDQAPMREEGSWTATGAGHFQALDSLRGICAFLVMLLHFPSDSTLVQNAFVHGSWMFVDFFFVLSGFVIASSYGQRLTDGYSIRRFMFLRFGRIYPTHLSVLLPVVLFYAAVTYAVATGHHLPEGQTRGIDALPSLLMTLTLTHALGFWQAAAWNAPSWSISVEFWTYLVAALMFRTRWNRLTLFSVMAVVALITLAVTGDSNLLRINEQALTRCLFGFGLGVCVFELRKVATKRYLTANGFSPAQGSVLEICIVIAVIGFVAWAGMGPATLLAPFLFATAVFIFSYGSGLVSRSLDTAVPRFLGRVSYPLYLVHYFLLWRLLNIGQIAQQRLGLNIVRVDRMGTIFSHETLAGNAASIAALALVLLAAFGLHLHVEEPGRLWSRRVARARHRDASPPAL